MIDAINFGYSSIHAGSLKSKNSIMPFSKLKASGGNEFFQKKFPNSKLRENINSLIVVSGGFASVGIISDIIARSTGLVSGEVSADTAKNMFKNAAFMAVIGAACFTLFKVIEKTVLKKICE